VVGGHYFDAPKGPFNALRFGVDRQAPDAADTAANGVQLGALSRTRLCGSASHNQTARAESTRRLAPFRTVKYCSVAGRDKHRSDLAPSSAG
jgi:hypothetical protein